MAMRRKEIVEKNEIYYENYIMGRRKQGSMWTAIFFIVVNFVLCWVANFLFKKMNFIKEAETLNLEGNEVMTWVDEQMQLNFWDPCKIGIIAFFIMMIGFIIWVYCWVKGYNLYKNKWIRIVPFIIMIIAFSIICFLFAINQNVVMALIIFGEAVQFIGLFKVLLPLKLRESYEPGLQFLEGLAQWIIKRF